MSDVKDLPDLIQNLSIPSSPQPSSSGAYPAVACGGAGKPEANEAPGVRESREIQRKLKQSIEYNNQEFIRNTKHAIQEREKLCGGASIFPHEYEAAVSAVVRKGLSYEDILNISLENKEIQGFIIQYARLLPNGKQTSIESMKRALIDFKSELESLMPSLDTCPEETMKEAGETAVGSYSDIMNELRMCIREDRKGLSQVDMMMMPLTDTAVSTFFEGHFPDYSKIPIPILRSVLSDFKSELKGRALEKVDNEKRRDEARKNFRRAYREYHDLVKSGQTPAQAMEILRLEQCQKDVEQRPACRESPPVLTEQMYRTTMGTVIDDDRLGIITYIDEGENTQGSAAFEMKRPEVVVRELSDYEITDETEDIGEAIHDYCERVCSYGKVSNGPRDLASDVEQDKSKRGRQSPGPPSKRRGDSHDRNPSPTKKGKVFLTRRKTYT